MSTAIFSPAATATHATPTIAEACQAALCLSTNDLLRIAIVRGCDHYAPAIPAPSGADAELDALPHEVLGAALLQGERNEETFSNIRCAAMVLGDLGNSPAKIAEAAAFFGVTSRLIHIARLALSINDHPSYWTKIRNACPQAFITDEESSFLPGLSRLTMETWSYSPPRKLIRTWLRTNIKNLTPAN